MKKIKVAVVQATPVLFNKAATVNKIETLSREGAKEGAELILFPESFIPCYPRGLSFGVVVGDRSPQGRELWQRYWEESVVVPGPETEELATLAAELKTWLALGITEREAIGGSLYCSFLIFSPTGKLVHHHRKLKPTAAERVVWAEGDGKSLQVIDTDFGKLGGLICWENYMPEARLALYRKGIDIYCAPTADQRDRWQSSMAHIALEGRCYVLSCNQYVRKEDYPKDLPMLNELEHQNEVMSRGGSVILSPMGIPIAGPLWDEEGILYATLDYSKIARAKMDFDVVGHYGRNDVFSA